MFSDRHLDISFLPTLFHLFQSCADHADQLSIGAPWEGVVDDGSSYVIRPSR